MTTPRKSSSGPKAKKITFEVPEYLEELRATLPPLLLFKEAAEALRMHTRTLHRYIGNGSIRAMRSTLSGASRVLIPRSEVIRFLAERPAR